MHSLTADQSAFKVDFSSGSLALQQRERKNTNTLRLIVAVSQVCTSRRFSGHRYYDRLETSRNCPTSCCGESAAGGAAPLPPSLLRQHGRCTAQTCCVLVFSDALCAPLDFSPSARRPSRLNPQPGHLTACVSAAETVLPLCRFMPASTFPCHVGENESPEWVLLSSCPPSSSGLFGCGRKKNSTKGGGDVARHV